MRVFLYSWYQMKPWGIDSGRLAVMESIILMCRSFSGLLVFPSWPWKNNDNKHHNITTTNHEYQQYDSKHQLFLRLLGWSLEIGSTSRLWGISKFRFTSGKRNQIKTYAIICRATGSVSTIASACLIVHNLQSHHGILVSTITYHRLVFGLSITDILSSFAHALGSTMVPKEMNFFLPGAQGNMPTCTAQGFHYTVGIIATNLYNCSICFYYLEVIRYNKKDEYIRNKLEPWFHVISIIIPLVVGFIFMTMKAYNLYDSVCFMVPNDEPHWIWYYENGETSEGFSTVYHADVVMEERPQYFFFL